MHKRIGTGLPGAVVLLMSAVRAAAEPVAEGVPAGDQLAQFKCVALGVAGFTLAGVGLLALLSLYGVAKARAVRCNGDRLRKHTMRAFLVGVMTALAAVLLAMIVGLLPDPLNGLCGLVLVLSVAYMVVGGLSVVAHELGDSVLSNLNSRHAGSSFASVLTGGALLGLCGFAIGVGQVLQLLALVLGLGVFSGGLVAGRRTKAAAADGGSPGN